MAEAAITVEGVYKDFVLPHLRANSVKSLFTGWWRQGGSKTKEAQHALRDISFEVKQGEFFGIVGRNGSGKSTMLKILAGIYQPTKGKVVTRGKLVPFIELGVGFNPELTGRENVYLNGAMLGFSRKEIEAMYDDIVSFAELEKFMDQKLKNYSSGMQVRLAFSMATRSEADILLVDEVLAVGDADFQRKCFDYFRTLKRNKKTVIFVSHDMSAVREYCDRAILIENSRTVDMGEAGKIADAYTKMFIEEAAEDQEDGAEGKRWGNAQATVDEVVLPKQLKDKQQNLIINAKVTAHGTLENLVIGFVIKTPDGRPLLGANTRIQEINTGSWRASSHKIITWTLPNIFREGKHTVDVAVLENDGITVCDWREDFASFQVYSTSRTPYIADPFVETKIKDESRD